MRALVIGGSGFIGTSLVNRLVNSGADVTVIRSGRAGNHYGDGISAIVADRFNDIDMKQKLNQLGTFDVVYDMLAFRIRDIKGLIGAFGDITDRYVFPSSAAVYGGHSGFVSEEIFDPLSLKPDEIASEASYSNGKKHVEAFLFQTADFHVACARFPNILGHGDSTGRFQYHLKKILSGLPFFVDRLDGRRNYAWVEDAGDFLSWLGMYRKEGSYNAASPESYGIGDILSLMGNALGCTVKLNSDLVADRSRYARESDLVLNTEKANSQGFHFTPTMKWIGNECKKYLDEPEFRINGQEYTEYLFR